jgi:predicted Zn finger-like uncharacterized protein
MIEIQCTSCQTRYRIDERILPEDTPTFKCSRCGHVFSAEPRPAQPRRTNIQSASPAAAKSTSPSETTTEDSPRPPADEAADTAPPAASSAGEEPVTRPGPQDAPSPAQADAAAQQTQADAARPPGRTGRRAGAEPRTDPVPGPDEPLHTASPIERVSPAPVRDDTRELLQRRFGDIPPDEPERPGENLAFDFSDEPRSSDQPPGPSFRPDSRRYPVEKWEADTSDIPPPPPVRPKRRIRISDVDDDLEGDAGLAQGFGRRPTAKPASYEDAERDFDRISPEEVSAQAHRLEAELRGQSYKLHSAGYFIGLFAMVIVAFGIVTIVIQSAPIASAGLLSALPIVGKGLEPPISPARRVALGQVQAQYVKLKGNQTALLISGTAENLTGTLLGTVEIEAALTGSGSEPLRSQAVYCGNNLSSKMLDEMTPHEIEFFEKLDAPKAFMLAPQAAAPFAIVFLEPPAGAARFQLRILRADPANESS